MNVASIDLNLLIALDALISEAHVGRAARKIGLSQPATSHALNRLRYLFTDQLLVRVGARMELTPRALALRGSLPDVLKRIGLLLVPESFDPQKSSRLFSLMLHDHIAHVIGPSVIRRVQSEAPGVTLNFVTWRNPQSIADARLRSVDLLISCSENRIAGFERADLFSDTEVTVVRRGRPSASRLHSLSAFLQAKHVAVAGGGTSEDPVDRWLREEGFTRQIAARVPSYMQAAQVVAKTDLVGFVPRRFAQAVAKPLALRLIPPPLNPGEYKECFFYPTRASQDPASQWLRRLVLDVSRRSEKISRAKRN